ncbi:ParB/RepB/Spo0J family partition protein [Micrococcus luteus]|uniref:ParB/RepB/Spo0J family partition protein n=1 Tax=Micrococcus luteus TaxID=1270 RepID=UPI0009B81776|nr:ParB/RepB/Spo0J family partition protein [Micrococcus luteus]MCV7528887.1 ParB/RepB/Spo0J family partition protein [Micrococcus luteus]MPZ03006.1 ParB/RepB/Spo0J family partition protein [Micrococcus luteus]
MKTSRRGGLGRGLGALIQSTVEVPEENAETSSSPKDSRMPAKSGPEAAAAAESTTTSTRSTATTKTSGESTEPDPSGPQRKTTARPPQAAKSTPATGRNASPGTQTGATSSKRASRPAQRPVDVFFSADSEDAPAARSTKGRPAMPTVKAPSKRATAAASSREEPVDTTAESVATVGIVSADIAVLREIPVGDIHPNPRQPREVFDEDHMAELVTSIREVGILQPIVVREVDGPTPYELIMGERRWRATQKAGLDTIPAIVRQTPDQDLLRDALLENLHRSQLNPLEEAAAYQQLMEDFACTQEELSQRIGRSRPQISNTLRLLKLPPLVQRRVAAGTLSAGHARALLGLTDPSDMERLAQRIQSEGLSVRATEEAVAQLQGGLRPGRTPQRSTDDARHERLDHYASALISRLDTAVKITLGARKGRIAIDFTTVEDLNRIMDLIQGGQDGKGKGKKS